MAAGVAAVVLVSAAAVTWQATRRAPAPPALVTPPAAITVPAETPAAPAPPDPRPAFLAARASFACGSATGEAVFVAPERALASIACPAGQGQLRLADGRDLLARVVPGAPAGSSVLAVPGAAAPFLPPADATGLSDGAPLLVGLEGAGRETIGEATARGLVPIDGLPLLRAEEAAGPLAGPVVDSGGKVVGLVPSEPPDPARPWLALPVEAFAGPLARSVPRAWEVAAEQAADEDRRAQGDLWNRLHRSAVLLAATPAVDGPLLVVARAVNGRPPAEMIRLAVDPPARDCNPYVRIADWRNGPRALDGVRARPDLLARLARLVPPPGGGTLWIGRGQGRLDCDRAGVADGATLSIPGSDPPAPVLFPRSGPEGPTAPAEVAVVAVDPEDPVARAAAAEEAAAWELGWRQAFRDANGRVAETKRRRLDLQAQREEARGNFQYALEQQLDTDIEVARMEERRALEALDDLDRRASLAEVPRMWRRPE
ncbi:MAG: hypothetical protein WCS72_07585 [Deltaproteobacteria bacterium]